MKKHFLLIVLLLVASLFTVTAQVTQFPFTEGFEGTTFPPSGWTQASTSAMPFYQWSRSTYSTHSGSGCASVSSESGVMITLTTPAFQFASGVSYEVKFWIYRQSSTWQPTTDDVVRVYQTATANDTTDATLLGEIHVSPTGAPAETGGNGWYQYTFTIPQVLTDSFITFAHISAGGATPKLDDITIRPVPTCADLAGTFSVTSKTTTTMTVAITDTTATSWDLGYRVLGTGAPRTYVTFTGTTGTVTGLTAGTNYSLVTRRNCTTETGYESDSITICTNCEAVTIPSTGWSDDLEGESTGYLAGCYVARNGVGQYSSSYPLVFNNPANAHSGNQLMGIGYNNTAAAPSSGSAPVGIYRQFHLEAGKYYEMSLYAKKSTYTYSDYSYPIVFQYGADTANLTDVATVTVNTTDYSQYAAYFQAPATGDYYLGFTAGKTSSYYLYADDYAVRELAILPPTDLSAVNIHSTSAEVRFTNNSGTAQIVVDTVAADVAQGRVFNQSGITASPLTVTGLTPNTTYYYAMRAINGTDTSVWSLTGSFTTAYTPATVPFSEDFETYTSATRLDNRWVQWAESGSYLYSTLQGATYNHTDEGVRGIAFTYSATSSMGSYSQYTQYLAKNFSLEAGKHYQVALYTKKSSSTYGDYSNYISFGVGSLDSAVIGSQMTVDNTDWLRFADYISVPSDGEYYIVIRTDKKGGSGYYSYIDDITVREVAAVPPTNCNAVNITPTTAEIDLTPQGTRTQLVVSDSLDDIYAGNIFNCDTITRTTVALTGLSADTYYYYALRTISGNDTSDWTLTGSFKTLCFPVSDLPFTEDFESYDPGMLTGCYDQSSTGDYVLNVISNSTYNHTASGSQGLTIASSATSTYGTSSQENFLFSRTFHLETGRNYELAAYMKRTTSTYTNDHFVDAVLIDNGFVSTIKTFQISNMDWANKRASFTVDSTADYTLGFSSYGSGYYSLYLDDITLREVSCVTPELSAVSVLVNSATITNIVDTAGNYEIVYDTLPLDFNDLSSVVEYTLTPLFGGFYQMTNLDPQTTYYVAARRACAANDTSDWSDVITITTACAVETLPFFDDFESYGDSTALVSCYAPFLGSDIDYYDLYVHADSTLNHTPGGSKGVTSTYTGYDYSFKYSTTYAAGFSRLFHFEAGHSYEISLAANAAKAAYSGPAIYSIYEGTTRDYTDRSHCQLLFSNNLTDDQWHVTSVTFIAATTQDLYVIVVSPAAQTSRYTIFDDFRVREVILDLHNDTICGGDGYQNYGFDVWPIDLHPGDTTLSREIAGTPDTLVVVNLHIVDYRLNLYDTLSICSNEPYSTYGTLPPATYNFIDTVRYTYCNCDSAYIFTHLTVYPAYSDTTVDVIDPSGTYKWRGQTYYTAGTFTENYQTVNGCDSNFVLVLTYTTAVDNVNDISMQIVPNPVDANSSAVIYGNFADDVTTVEVLNSFGQVIESFTPTTYPIVVNGISASGLYYVRLTTRDGSVHLQKLVVK